MNNKYIYSVKKPCPVCEKETHIIRVKARILIEKTDDDFCTYYKDFNPYLYEVATCEHCGYSALEKDFLTPLPKRYLAHLREFLPTLTPLPYKEERKLEDAYETFLRAIAISKELKAKPSTLAGLYLRLSWLCRVEGDQEKDEQALQEASNLYNESLMTERYPIDQMTDNMVIYLLGAISYRLGDLESATQALSRVISDKRVREEEYRTFQLVRKLWQKIREERKMKQSVDIGEIEE